MTISPYKDDTMENVRGDSSLGPGAYYQDAPKEIKSFTIGSKRDK